MVVYFSWMIVYFPPMIVYFQSRSDNFSQDRTFKQNRMLYHPIGVFSYLAFLVWTWDMANYSDSPMFITHTCSWICLSLCKKPSSKNLSKIWIGTEKRIFPNWLPTKKISLENSKECMAWLETNWFLNGTSFTLDGWKSKKFMPLSQSRQRYFLTI